MRRQTYDKRSHVVWRILLKTMLILGLSGSAFAQEEDPFHVPSSEELTSQKSYSWRTEASELKIDESVLAVLEKQRFIVLPQAYRQAFEAYTQGEDPAIPFFITSDSILNAFHILLEESVRQVEMKNAALLQKALPLMIDSIYKLPVNAKDPHYSSALFKAKGLLLVAASLMHCHLRDKIESDAKLLKIVMEEIQHIQAGSGLMLSPLLGRKIDYGRCQVRGFYSNGEMLRRYFQSISYWSGVAFEVENDEDLLTGLILGWTVSWVGGSKAAEPFFEMESNLASVVRRIFFAIENSLPIRKEWA